MAIGMEFFLARKIPLPDEMRGGGGRFIISAPPESIMAFWTKQLARLDKMIAQSTTQEEWQKRTPDSIGRVAGALKTVTITQLLNRYNMGDQNWMQQFIFGFLLIGILSQKGVFPIGGEPDTNPTQPQKIRENHELAS